MKFFTKFFVMILLLFAFVSVANAALIDDVSISCEEEATLITVSGNSECANIGDAITVFVALGEEEEIPESESAIEYIDIISVDRKTEFTHSFAFKGSENKYVIGVKDQFGNLKGIVKDLYTKADMDQFAFDLRDKILSGEVILSKLNLYAKELEITDILNDSRVVTDMKDILLSDAVLDIDSGFEDIPAIIEVVKKEWDLLYSIENANYWYTIAEIIDDNWAYMGVNSKWTSYSSKQSLCENLVDYTCVDLPTLAKKINDAMEAPPQPGGGGGSGGGITPIEKEPDVVTPPPVSTSNPFVDIEDVDWAKTAILSLVEDGVLDGVGNDCFDPHRMVKREELAKMLILAFDIPVSEDRSGFNDVPADSWYADYVYALSESGISNGVSESEFGVGTYVSRQDIATLLYRLMESKGYSHTTSDNKFDDSDDIAEYASVPVQAMAGYGIINGVGDNMFAPLSNTTRAQAAKLIYEVKKQIN